MNRDNKIKATIDRIAKSDEIHKYVKSLEKAKPWPLKIFGDWLLLNILFPETGDYRDSTSLEFQKPAAFSAIDILGQKEDAQVLYVASSYGLGMTLIAAAGYKNVRGIDVDAKAVAFCQSQGLDARVMDALRIDFPDNFFDMVVSRDFVVSDYNPELNKVAILNEQFKVLKSGAFAVFTTMLPVDHVYMGRQLRGMPNQDMISASNFSGSKKIEKIIMLNNPWQGPFRNRLQYYQKP